MLGLGIPAAQEMVETMVAPKVAWGTLAKPLPRDEVRLLRTSVRRAMGVEGRLHSWHAVAAVVGRPHRVDPEGVIFYQHCVAVVRAVRSGAEAHDWWMDLCELGQSRRDSGPRGVWVEFLRRLGLEERSPTRVRSRRGEIDWLAVELPKFQHFMRDAIRVWLWRKPPGADG